MGPWVGFDGFSGSTLYVARSYRWALGSMLRIELSYRYAERMTGPLLILLLLLPLTPPFGEATASATSIDDGRLRLEVSVEVAGSPVAVLVRGIGDGEAELPPVALANRGDGNWEGIVELPVVANIRVGFEFIPARGEATVSELHNLTELGVGRAVFDLQRIPTGFGDDEGEPLVSTEGRRWGWLGLAAGAAALTLLALWTIGSLRARRDEEISDENPHLTGHDEAGDLITD